MRTTDRVQNDSWYVWVGWIVGGLMCLGVWVYSFFVIGLLGGLLVGWLPALIFGFIAGIVWPLTIALSILGAMLQLFN